MTPAHRRARNKRLVKSSLATCSYQLDSPAAVAKPDESAQDLSSGQEEDKPSKLAIAVDILNDIERCLVAARDILLQGKSTEAVSWTAVFATEVFEHVIHILQNQTQESSRAAALPSEGER